jgi:oligoribonuclease (3'-5' exoribonuclease)
MINPQYTFCICDFETTGVDTTQNSIDYPIEIGCIFTDASFRLLSTYQSYIYYKWMDSYEEWPDEYQKAAVIHDIPFSKLKFEGTNVKTVRKEILSLCLKYQKNNEKPTIISDCSNFEFFFMKKIFEDYDEEKFPFHYCAWHVNPLLSVAGVEYVEENSHSALNDAANMHHALVRALQNVGYFNKE